MNHDDIERLLGGYATNTLSEEERKALFEAALNDQALFDALQEEEPLRDLLSDRNSREQIAQALEKPAKQEFIVPWWRKPWILAFSGSLAAGCLLLAVLLNWRSPQSVTSRVAATNQIPDRPIVASPNVNDMATVRPKTEQPRAKARRTQQIPGGQALTQNAPVASPVPAAPPPPMADRKAETEPAQKEVVSVTDQKSVVQTAPAPTPEQLGRTQQSTQSGLAGAPLASAGKIRGGFVLTKKSPPASLAVSVVRGDEVLKTADSIQSEDSVRLRVKPLADGFVQLFQVDAAAARRALGPQVAIQAGRDVTIPPAPLSISQMENLLLVFTAADGSQQTVVIVLAPGKPPIVR